jgi:8-oxo-dGTP pyrophosphatase MutT (NUDIX family)
VLIGGSGTRRGAWEGSSQPAPRLGRIDALALLDELQAIARTGLAYATDPYDRERYERLLDLAVRGYADTLAVPPQETRARLARDLGYVSAKVGADAAIFDADDRVLLVLRSDDRTWGLVSGWVDPGETPADTAVREVKEEVGLDATVVALVDAIGRPAGADGRPHGVVSVLYLCTVAPGPITVSHESLDAQYRRIDEVETWHANHEHLARVALEHHRAGG